MLSQHILQYLYTRVYGRRIDRGTSSFRHYDFVSTRRVKSCTHFNQRTNPMGVAETGIRLGFCPTQWMDLQHNHMVPTITPGLLSAVEQ